jgi:hypothetical protein
LMTRAERAIQVQFVLTTTIIYQAMALELPHWIHKAIDKIWCSYLWRGRKEAKGGHCLVAWTTLTRPKEMGGLGIDDLKTLGRTLRVAWRWLKNDLDESWAFLPLQMSPCVDDLCSMAVTTEIEYGSNSLFYKGCWISGQ